ncbi:hemin uptake protein HemP [Brachymonas sp. M4Q-1]|uniref:hemin uptake protein HemP n=1 Tax=Brachymonas sp. M4Q-1 TaxID=3416906 RepID=UPI003CEEE9F4
MTCPARPDAAPASSPASSTSPAAAVPVTVAPTDRCIASEALLQGKRSVTIVHQGETYRLQSTRQGKLILTK